MTRRLVAAALAALALAVVASGSAAAQSATVSPDCGDGNDTGVLYATESGLSVVDDAPSPPPENGTIRNNTTARVGNLTLSADGNASVRVENATAPACLAAIDATETPLTVGVDGVGTVVVNGTAERLAIGTADGTVTLAYNADQSVTVTVRNVSFATGTDVDATDDTGATLATGTVSETGTLRLSLPAGTAPVTLTTAQSDDTSTDESDTGGSDGGDGTSSGTDGGTEQSDGSGTATPGGDGSATATPGDDETATGGTDIATETSTAPSGADTTPVPDSDATPTESDQTESASGPTTTSGGAGPGFGVGIAVAGLLGGLSIGSRRRG